MPAIITNNLRLSNALDFIDKIENQDRNYYAFIGLPNPTEYLSSWNSNPISPRDSFDEQNSYWDNMIALKKITPSDVSPVIRKITWESGTIYDMYRHDVSRTRVSIPSRSTNLYSSNFYVVNSEYKVYICLDNGIDPENPNGRPSLDEPLFTDLEPRSAGDSGDGYIWKYLYTIRPSDIIKYDSTNFIPVPKRWGEDPQTLLVKQNSLTSGQIKIVKIVSRGKNLGRNQIYRNVPIRGDGNGALVTITTNNDSEVENVIVTSGGSDYTFGTVDISSLGILDEDSILPLFNVIIPPSNGHGFNIYKELGSTYVMLHTKIENDLENPDFIIGNQFARIGIIENPLKNNTSELLTEDKCSALKALKLIGIDVPSDYTNAFYPPNSTITQTIGTGVTSVGRVVSYDQATGVLKYWQDRSLYGFNYDLSRDPYPTYGIIKNQFTSDISEGGSLTIKSETIDLQIDSSFGTEANPGISTQINNSTYQLGQSFIGGVSSPEVKYHSGNIIYVDHRASVTRSPNQRETIKIILQF